MFCYIRRWNEDKCITSEIFSKNVSRISIWKSGKRIDFGEHIEELLNVMVWFLDDHTENYDDVVDVEVM